MLTGSLNQTLAIGDNPGDTNGDNKARTGAVVGEA